MAPSSVKPVQLGLAVATLLVAQAPRPLEGDAGEQTGAGALAATPELTPTTPFHWTGRNIFAVVLAAACALLANSAGIGGGPFYMPLLNSVVGFDLSASTGLSHTIVATSALASSAYGLLNASPRDPQRTLCDFDIALLFVPALLLGVDFGVLFNTIFPEWLRTLLLTLLLLVVIYKTALKGYKQWQQEQHTLAKARGAGGEHESLLPGENGGDHEEHHGGWTHDESHHDHPSRLASLKRQSMQAPIREVQHDHQVERPDAEKPKSGLAAVWARLPLLQIGALLVLWVAFSLSQLLKARYPNCSRGYFVVFGLQAGVLFALIIGLVHVNANKTRRSPLAASPELRAIILGSGEDATPERRDRAEANLFKVTGVMFFSGFVAGLLGIGGALIFNPILLQLGVHPQVTASTAVLMILFSSGAISLSFGVQGLLNTSYALVFAPICFLASLTGVTVLGRIIRASGRVSIIVLLLTGLIAVGTLLTAVLGGQKAVAEIRAGQVGFRPLCPS